ncbi:hypothetical protein PYCCODRAFT_1456176 [Trametes coccinea BRFM310]|uniref:Uncharacterized protein n=1 Tax=Trametes coccinea (strain BRFM310) TaxID=1353009 RepID=A0A1Y2J1L8_TRAC3|nr:hypothetical protein PYCCODRAFT_1456176 [Trametes coccinea BRFM310]
MVSRTLSLVIIEYILDFLRGDFKALGKCTLLCRGLLPICRTYLYEDISLSHQVVNAQSVETERTKQFFRLVDANPGILLYVRNLTLDYGHDNYHYPPVGAIDQGIAWKTVLRRQFSSLRSLTLSHLATSGSLCYLITIITGILPKLESLSFRHMRVFISPSLFGIPLSVETAWKPHVWVARGGARQSNLHAFSIVDVYNEADELSELVSFLGNYPALVSLDIRPVLPQDSPLPAYPSLVASSFAPRSLRHLGVLVNDTTRDGIISTDNRERMDAILSDLPQFSSLRSLCLHYSCIDFCLNTMVSYHQLCAGRSAPQISPFFIYTLCRVLSSTPDPFPFLEQLVIALHTPLKWLKDWTDALDCLGRVLIGERIAGNAPIAERAERYPKFRRLEICAHISELVRFRFGDRGVEDVRMQIREVKEGFLHPFLERLEEAGIEVDIRVV